MIYRNPQAHAYFSTVIHFQHEDFHNAGLKSERIIEIVSKIEDPFGFGICFNPKYTGCNGNICIETRARNTEDLYYIVEMIEDILQWETEKLSKNK